jgi:tetratricopeptide (TPR) repeat protein
MSFHEHYTLDELLNSTARSDVAAHLSHCSDCHARAARADIEALLRDPDVWAFSPSAGTDNVMPKFPPPPLAPHDPENIAVTAAGIMRTPLQHLSTYLDRHPDASSELVAEHLIASAARELERQPTAAVGILDRAEEVAARLRSADAAAEYRSEIWKARSNVCWFSGDYQDALDAIDVAWKFADQHAAGAFIQGQLSYARGCALWKLGLLTDAAAAARDSAVRLAEYGDVRRIAHARLLEAVVRTEQGDVAGALHIYTVLRPHLEELGDAPAAARVIANVAVSHLRLHDYTRAKQFALEAQTRHRQLGNDVEGIRMDWLLGLIDAASGNTDSAIAAMLQAVRAFEALDMFGDAGFVRLDLVAEYLKTENNELAARFAREAAETFAKNGARLHLMEALDYLRQAVQRREATPMIVENVSAYIRADDPNRPFKPS